MSLHNHSSQTSQSRQKVPQDLLGLWQVRAQALLKEMGKYGRLIVNDHFSIILLVLLAFLGLYYREILTLFQQADLSQWVLPLEIFFSLGLTLLTQIGGPIWLTLAPDEAYLFSQGRKWQTYWLKGTRLGLVLPLIITALISALLLPFVVNLSAWTLNQWPVFIGLTAILTALNIFARYYNVLHQAGISNAWRWLASFIYSVALIHLGAHWNMIVPLGLALVASIYLYQGLKPTAQTRLQFDRVVELDQQRRAVFYKWIAIFADVPNLQPTVKRRAYLDRLIQALPMFNQQAYSYLLLRLLVRHGAYSGVWLKVTAFIAFLLIWSQPLWLAIALGILGQWMTLIQLLPLRSYPNDQVFFRLYPQKGDSLAAFRQLMGLLLVTQAIIYTLASGYWLSFLAWLVSIALLLYLYLPWRERKSRF
ncbi:ABC transporter permease [Ignavigranum ruoffiae]|uniref:ABC transporter permease n=1 Tax=Ignavigranum ruoffiae TaxID=89093 RepID=UPI0020496F6B|nr:ABC transporter permease [Ignavigranum ruoffiae]UPQ85130.1 ABC transporter permease [Ignavigranum ruoffiae]